MCGLNSSDNLRQHISVLYDQGRRHVVHEDDLVDRRLKWAIAISGFLFAAYGATWVAFTSFPPEIVASIYAVQLVVALMGIGSSLVAIPSIHAAHLAIRAITRKYNKFIESNAEQIESEKIQVWKLIGDRITHVPGFYSSLFIPFGLAASWFLVAFSAVNLIAYSFSVSLEAAFIYPYILSALFFILLIFLHLLFGYARRLLQRIQQTEGESETVKALRAAGLERNISIISEDSFLWKPFSQDNSKNGSAR